MIKNLLREIAQRLLGLDRYLFWFARLGGWRLRFTGYEKEFRYFMDLLPASGVILDIGANIGITTAALCRKHPGVFVCAFEPMPVNLRILDRIIRHYRLQNVKVSAYALGNTNGRIDMIMPEIGDAVMHGLSHVIEDGAADEKGEVFSVHIHRMDDVEELRLLPEITGIKLDVENFEYHVLQGGLALIRQHQPVIFCELWGNERKTQCIELLQDAGYQVRVYHKGALVDFNGQPAINFFFLPPNSSYFHPK